MNALQQLLCDESLLLETASDSCFVVRRRADRKIGYVVPPAAAPIWTQLDHGENVLCHARGFVFGYDISTGGRHAFRVAHLSTDEVLYDAPLARHTLAVHLSPTNELFYTTTDGTVCYWHEGLKFEHTLTEKEQAVALDYCSPDRGVLALTHNHVFLVHGHKGVLFCLKIPVRPRCM